MKSATGTTLEKYTYGAGRRRLVTQAGETSNNRTYYAWDGQLVAVEFTESDAAPSSPKYSRAYAYWGGRQLVTYLMSGSTELVAHNADDTFGPRLVVSTTATTQNEQVVFPFGTRVATESTTTTSRTYDAYERSSTTDLDYALNRYYSSSQGRFCQVDPLGFAVSSPSDPQSSNLFAYGRNDPVNLRDPSGELYTTCKYRRTDWTDSSLPQYGVETVFYDCITYGFSSLSALVGDPDRAGPGRGGGRSDGGAVKRSVLPPNLAKAIDNALKHLQDQDCKNLYASVNATADPAATLQSLLDQDAISYSTTSPSGTEMGQRIAAATKGHGESARIAFNSTSPGPFVSGSYLTPGGNDVYLGNWQSYPTNPYYGLGLNSMQTLFVLHELLHVMDLQDRFADADDAERHFQNSRTVSLRCKL